MERLWIDGYRGARPEQVEGLNPSYIAQNLIRHTGESRYPVLFLGAGSATQSWTGMAS